MSKEIKFNWGTGAIKSENEYRDTEHWLSKDEELLETLKNDPSIIGTEKTSAIESIEKRIKGYNKEIKEYESFKKRFVRFCKALKDIISYLTF